jgi:hypothetical protein
VLKCHWLGVHDVKKHYGRRGTVGGAGFDGAWGLARPGGCGESELEPASAALTSANKQRCEGQSVGAKGYTGGGVHLSIRAAGPSLNDRDLGMAGGVWMVRGTPAEAVAASAPAANGVRVVIVR